MSAVRVTASRTIGRARNQFLTAVAIGGFLAVSALFFAFGLESAEGGELSVAVVWATSVGYVLPALAALLSMDVWSEEFQTGRIDMMLTLAVRERDFVLGKFFGVLVQTMFAIVLNAVLSVSLLAVQAPQALEGCGFGAFLLAMAALFVQSTLWCALGVAMSTMFRHAATVVCLSLALMVVLPRGLWFGMRTWASSGRPSFGEFPFDAHVVDIASGMVPSGMVVAYFVTALIALFVASKLVAGSRLSGSGKRGLCLSTVFSVFLAIAVVALSIPFLLKVNPTVEIPVIGDSIVFSPRTRGVLSESSGDIEITCFLPRGDVRFRSIARVLRHLKRESEAVGGARLLVRFVDPRWDIGAAERLVRKGVRRESVVFEKGRRMVVVPLADGGLGERLCASAIRSISVLMQRRTVYWTVGHGESSYSDYDAFGMSDIARDLACEGFRNERIDLASAPHIPGDCALIIVAGAKEDFSRVETGRIDAYLREGGRLLALLGASASGGVVSMLPAWGMRPLDAPIKDAKTLSGTDVLSSDFTDHPISAPLKGSRIVLERPVSFVPSAAVGTGSGADKIDFQTVAKAGLSTVVGAIERGSGAGRDLALRPTRIVAIGDAGFALNGALAVRASANRDFFLNCVSYLSGIETHGFGDDGSARLRTGWDREARLKHAVYSVGILPFLVFLVLSVVVIRRRFRV